MYFSLFTTQEEYENYLLSAACLQGTDFGCCGNYEGCCVYATWFCLKHDIECKLLACEPTWYCFTSCVP